jgi:hypothetical protein
VFVSVVVLVGVGVGSVLFGVEAGVSVVDGCGEVEGIGVSVGVC